MNFYLKNKIDGLVQERRNSIANALVLRLSCTNPNTVRKYDLESILCVGLSTGLTKP